MRAIALTSPKQLREIELPTPTPGPGELLLKVHACGVCRTDLHLLDGELQVDRHPRVLGHQIVGTTEDGTRLGVPWLGATCGRCAYCTSGRENLCPHAKFTGRDIDGGFAEYAVADERFCFPIPDGYPDLQAAPLLCAGLIGYRALRMTGDAADLGLYGFGAAAHIIAQVATHQGRRVFAVSRGDLDLDFARGLGATWAGTPDARPPEPLDAVIIFAPAGELVPKALRDLKPGGVVVTAGIHMSDIPSFPYELLWHERQLRSVANLTRADGTEFLELAPHVPVSTHVTRYALEQTPDALEDLRHSRFRGAAVVTP
jgi:propanol-preferring alcohol dehydrogenase